MAFHLVGPQPLSRTELRRLIPTAHLIQMQVEAAMTGFLRTYGPGGEELQAASPITTQQRLDITDKLLKKTIPDIKTDDDAAPPPINIEALSSDPDQIKRFTTAEIRAAIDASFKLTHAGPPTVETPEDKE